MAQHSFPQIDKIKKEEEILEVRWNFLSMFLMPMAIIWTIFISPVHLKIRSSELARYPLDIRGNTLLMIEKDDNGNIFWVKYRMLI